MGVLSFTEIFPPKSLLSRGAWIEMSTKVPEIELKISLLSRGAWIEIYLISLQSILKMSLLSRGAWIEIANLAWEI